MTMTARPADDIDPGTRDWTALTAQLTGALLLPGEDGCAQLSTPWNVAVPSRPAAVVRTAGAVDVAVAVQVMLQDLHAGAQHWFDDSDYAFPSTDLADGELSRDGRWLAEIRGY